MPLSLYQRMTVSWFKPNQARARASKHPPKVKQVWACRVSEECDWARQCWQKREPNGPAWKTSSSQKECFCGKIFLVANDTQASSEQQIPTNHSIVQNPPGPHLKLGLYYIRVTEIGDPRLVAANFGLKTRGKNHTSINLELWGPGNPQLGPSTAHRSYICIGPGCHQGKGQ